MIAANMSQNTTEPTAITAGDTVNWTKSLANYPASAGWVLTYTIINASNKYTVTATASGDSHLVSVAAGITSAWASGEYTWQSKVSKGVEVYTVAIGDLTISPSFAAQTTLDSRSVAAKALEAIEATLAGRATSATAEYEIAGRKLKYTSHAELIRLRDFYKRVVVQEEAAARVTKGLSDPRRILVRFGP